MLFTECERVIMGLYPGGRCIVNANPRLLPADALDLVGSV